MQIYHCTVEYRHRLNMELDLQSIFGFHVTWCAQLYSLAVTRQPPIPQHLSSYTRALLISQDRRHLFVAPWIMCTKETRSICSHITSNVNDIETKTKTLRYRILLSERKQNVLIWSASDRNGGRTFWFGPLKIGMEAERFDLVRLRSEWRQNVLIWSA